MRSFRAILLRGVEGLIVTVFAVLVLNVLWGVISRYVLGDQARWSEELARLLMVWLALLGAVLALVQKEHLGVDVLVRKLHVDAQPMAQICVQMVVLLFAVLVLSYGGFQLTLQRWEAGQTLPALGISKAWFYLAIPISGLLMALVSLEEMVAVGRRDSRASEQSE